MLSFRIFELECASGDTTPEVVQDLSKQFEVATEQLNSAWQAAVDHYGMVEKSYVEDMEDYQRERIRLTAEAEEGESADVDEDADREADVDADREADVNANTEGDTDAEN